VGTGESNTLFIYFVKILFAFLMKNIFSDKKCQKLEEKKLRNPEGFFKIRTIPNPGFSFFSKTENLSDNFSLSFFILYSNSPMLKRKILENEILKD